MQEKWYRPLLDTMVQLCKRLPVADQCNANNISYLSLCTIIATRDDLYE